MHKTIIRRALGALVLSTMGATLASASAIYLAPETMSFTSLSPSSVQNIAFDKFDASLYSSPGFLAVLTSVQVDVSTTSTGTINVVNLSAIIGSAQNTQFTNARATVPVQITSVGGLNFGLNSVVNTCGTVATPNPGSGAACTNTGSGTLLDPYGIAGATYPSFQGYGLASNDSQNRWTSVTGTASQTAFVGPAGFGAFSGFGPGTFNVTITAGGASATGLDLSAQYLSFGGTLTSSGNVSITYGYDLVAAPEPMTVSLAGFALVGLGVMRFRKRA